MTLHNAKGLEFPIVFIIGMRGGRLPALARDRRGRRSRRSAGSAYVGITRAMRDLYLTYARTPQRVRRARLGLRSRFLDEIPRELTDRRGARPPRRRRASPPGARRRGAAATRAAARRRGRAAAVFRLGDDVVHAAFGEGVVTGVEPGGIVVVRFAGDGSERKLMADYAPITKR